MLTVLKSCDGPNFDMTSIGPLVTPAGAVTVIELSLLITGVPAVFLESTPLNRTLVTCPLCNCTPVIVTVVSTLPYVGVKLVT